MMSDKENQQPASYMRSLVGGRKRSFPGQPLAMIVPSSDQIDIYDNDIAKAIRSHDVDQLRGYLEEGRSFEGCNRNGESHLHLACRRGDVETVEFLILEACVETTVRDSMGRTALHDAAWRPTPDLALMETLIKLVSPELLVAQDVRGHACFDYTRKDDNGTWMAFLEKFSDVIQRRAKIVGLARCL